MPCSQLTPEETGTENKRSKAKGQDRVGTMNPVESLAERTCVERMEAIVRFEHPDMKLATNEATKVEM